MENTGDMQKKETPPRKKRRVWGWTVILIRSLFILLFTVILLGGLYFKAPWKVLVLDALLLALLTVVPKRKRKYGWLALAAAVLAVVVWIFIPEKDSGNWRPYTFDEELAALEAERMVPPEIDAAPLYEDLFQRWKQIEEDDPFPQEVDDEYETLSQPWTKEEFPEVAAWFDRHDEFFDDLISATQKSACYFPASVTVIDFSKSLERLSPVKHFAQHLIRVAYLDIGQHNNILSAYQKQLSVLNLGKHMNQQPLMVDMLTGIGIETLAYDALKRTLIQQPFPEDIMVGDFQAMMVPMRKGHFDSKEKWQQILEYEKIFEKNNFGMLYEINQEGKVRYARGRSIVDIINQMLPLEEDDCSYWDGVFGRFSVLMLWGSGLPKDPTELSRLIDNEWQSWMQNLDRKKTWLPQLHEFIQTGPLFNYKELIYASLNWSFLLHESGKRIFEEYSIKRKGTVLVCNLVLYKKQNGQYPNMFEELWSPELAKEDIEELYGGCTKRLRRGFCRVNGGFALYFHFFFVFACVGFILSG